MKDVKERNQLLEGLNEEKAKRVLEALKQGYKAVNREFPVEDSEQVEMVYDTLMAISKPMKEEIDENGFQKSDRLNIYTDGEGIVMITRDINVGNSAFVVNDKKSGRLLKSLCYLVPQDIIPTHEWYKPCLEEHKLLGIEMRKHVSEGGLLLREIGKSFEVSFKEQIKRLTNSKLNEGRDIKKLKKK